jgi:hypothetical protein
MLGSVLAVWIMWRIVVWEMPLPQVLKNISEVPQAGVVVLAGRSPDLEANFPGQAVQDETESVLLEKSWADPARFQAPVLVPLEPSAAGTLAIEPAVAAGHQIMWMAAMAQLPMPSAVARLVRGEQTAQAAAPSGLPPAPMHEKKGRRWSMDGWLFLREGSQANSPSGIVPASYGASQAGAVLRYSIAPQSRLEPVVYTRATKALAASREADLAVGLSARPHPRLPLTANAELRATRVNGKTDLRPAAFAVLQPAPVPLPAEFSAEAYAQAGYVGGDFATGFADGQLRVTREIARFDLGTVSAGAGAWGGAQKGASRLDVGPSASLRLTLGEMPARLSVDYRVRAAGDATPGNGAAVTLSTGF